MEYIDFLEPLFILSQNRPIPLDIIDRYENNLLMIAIILQDLFNSTKIIDLKRAFIQKLIDIGYLSSLSLGEQAATKRDRNYLLKIFPFIQIIKQLIPNYDLNYLNINGENALMISASACLHEIFEILIEKKKTNIYHRDLSGKTILDRIFNCSETEYLPMEKQVYENSIKFKMIQIFNEEILETIPQLIRAENKNFLISLIHTYINNNLINELIEIIDSIESITGYSLNVNVKNLIANYQNTIPKPLSKNTLKYPRSGRPITQMSKLINKSTLPRLPLIEPRNIFNNFYIDTSCFCLDVPIGLYHNKYIPVLRYGKSATHGYYGTLTGQEHVEASFTWYYIEPDSDIYLHGDNVFVARNKLQAVLALNRLLVKKNKGTIYEEPTYIEYKIEKLIYESIKEYLDEVSFEANRDDLYDEFYPMDIKNGDYFVLACRVNLFMENEEKPILGTRFTNFFRTIEEAAYPTEIYFANGLLDYLDETIDILAKKLDIDIIILTHQSGNSGRLVSELLDTRKRSLSFSNLYLKS